MTEAVPNPNGATAGLVVADPNFRNPFEDGRPLGGGHRRLSSRGDVNFDVPVGTFEEYERFSSLSGDAPIENLAEFQNTESSADAESQALATDDEFEIQAKVKCFEARLWETLAPQLLQARQHQLLPSEAKTFDAITIAERKCGGETLDSCGLVAQQHQDTCPSPSTQDWVGQRRLQMEERAAVVIQSAARGRAERRRSLLQAQRTREQWSNRASGLGAHGLWPETDRGDGEYVPSAPHACPDFLFLLRLLQPAEGLPHAPPASSGSSLSGTSSISCSEFLPQDSSLFTYKHDPVPPELGRSTAVRSEASTRRADGERLEDVENRPSDAHHSDEDDLHNRRPKKDPGFGALERRSPKDQHRDAASSTGQAHDRRNKIRLGSEKSHIEQSPLGRAVWHQRRHHNLRGDNAGGYAAGDNDFLKQQMRTHTDAAAAMIHSGYRSKVGQGAAEDKGHSRQFECEHEAALIIQRRIRSKAARLEASDKVFERDEAALQSHERERAAIIIQSHAPGTDPQLDAAPRKEDELNRTRSEAEKPSKTAHEDAAGERFNVRDAELKRRTQEEAVAIRIQSVARGRLARREAMIRRRCAKAKPDDTELASTACAKAEGIGLDQRRRAACRSGTGSPWRSASPLELYGPLPQTEDRKSEACGANAAEEAPSADVMKRARRAREEKRRELLDHACKDSNVMDGRQLSSASEPLPAPGRAIGAPRCPLPSVSPSSVGVRAAFTAKTKRFGPDAVLDVSKDEHAWHLLGIPPTVSKRMPELLPKFPFRAASPERAEAQRKGHNPLITEAFNLIDSNGTGVLTTAEISAACRKLARVRKLLKLPAKIRTEDGSGADFDAVFRKMDARCSQAIDLAEFQAFFQHHLSVENALELRATDAAAITAIFNVIDINGDGAVRREEIILACRKDARVRRFFGLPDGKRLKQNDGGRERLDQVFRRIGLDGSSKISLKEFEQLLVVHKDLFDSSCSWNAPALKENEIVPEQFAGQLETEAHLSGAAAKPLMASRSHLPAAALDLAPHELCHKDENISQVDALMKDTNGLRAEVDELHGRVREARAEVLSFERVLDLSADPAHCSTCDEQHVKMSDMVVAFKHTCGALLQWSKHSVDSSCALLTMASALGDVAQYGEELAYLAKLYEQLAQDCG